MTLVEAVRDGASAVAFLLLAGFVSANVRRLAAEKGWDNILLNLWDWSAHQVRRISGSSDPRVDDFIVMPWRGKWLFWLALGLSVGIAISLWLVSVFPPQQSFAIGISPIGGPVTERPQAPKPRVYTDKTVADLAAFYQGRTAMQGDAFMTDEKGKWINVEGKLQYLQPNGNALFFDDVRPINCTFDAKWNAKLNTLRQFDLIKFAGKIAPFQTGLLTLEECELR
jgi:hypothetical protein